nr:MAG TPA: Cell wall hydrolase autolysin [Caudoviricetes sp.]
MNKVALIIGHNQRSKGAYSTIVGSEYDYWKRIAEKIKTEIPALVDIYERKPNKAYIPEMNEVLKELNKNDYGFCLELHFNSSLNRNANGCECLVYYKNEKAKELATNFMARLQNVFESKIRNNHGIIEVKESSTRGGYGICKSKDTYILLEPFFGSNQDESLKFSVEGDVVDLFVGFIKNNIKEV